MIKVTLRSKPISDNRLTLYLDYYPPIPHPVTGRETRREFLKLFVYDNTEHEEKLYVNSEGRPQRRIVPLLGRNSQVKKIKLTEIEKHHNKETYALAQAIRAQRQLSVQKGSYGFLSDEKVNTNFIEYFEALANKRKGSNSDNWLSALHYLKDFAGGGIIRFKDLNENFGNDFKEYLLTVPSRKSKRVSLSQNSAVSYFNKFKAALKQAHKESYLEDDLNKRIETIKHAETERHFLTFDELQMLARTECASPVLKRAALFSALTGLRFSDIQKLVWSEVHYGSDDGHYIRFRQQKTKGVETLPISEQAAALLGEPPIEIDQPVFVGLDYSLTQSVLPKWLKASGLKKQFSFHGFRHTYATLLLSKGIDLYTISKMLGHREIKTTQVYAKIIDKQKRNAADTIKLTL
jgi:integrase